LSDETLSNQRYQNLINHRKKAEFKAPKMKPMRFIQATPKAKTKILSQKRKTSNDSKGKSSQRAKKKRLETSSDSEDYDEKDLVDDKSDGSLNLGNSDDETQM
jgi:hypothetical protein